MSLADYYFIKKNREVIFSIATNIYWVTTYCVAHGTLLNVMRQPEWEGNFG